MNEGQYKVSLVILDSDPKHMTRDNFITFEAYI
jgi:hypothetical protein